MDVTLLFFLPLIGGFLFVERFYGTRFRAARQETQRLYYQAAFYGVVLSVLGFALHRALTAVPAYRGVVRDIGDAVLGPLLARPTSTSDASLPSRSVAVRVELAFACAWALVLGASTPLLNAVVAGVDWFVRRCRRRSLISRMNDASITDQFERLLAAALRRASQIQVTLSNQKVYVGWVTNSPNPTSQEKYFCIQPSMSGYRSAETGEVIFTTFYDDVLERLHDDPQRLRSYEIVVPMDKIVSASGFDPSAYDAFETRRSARREVHEPVETRLSGDVTIRVERQAPRTTA